MVELDGVADAYVYDATASADSSFGTQSSLVVKKSAAGFNRVSYLRFNVPTPDGLLLNSTLQLYCLAASTPGVHGVAQVDETTWTEAGLTWNNQPTAGALISSWTPFALANSTVDVSTAITSSGPVSFKVYGTNQTTDGYVTYASRENTTATNRPRLRLLIGHTPPEVQLTAPEDGSILRAGPQTLNADAVAKTGSIDEVAFYDGETLLGKDSASPYTFTTNLSGGSHSLSVIATDSNGFSRSSLNHRVDVDYPPSAASTHCSTHHGTSVSIDLWPLVQDHESPTSDLKIRLGSAQHGSVTLLSDGHTAVFTPDTGYTGPAHFDYTAIDTTRSEDLLLNYTFEASDTLDNSGLDRDGSLFLQGSGSSTFDASSPLSDYTQSLRLVENGTSGAARLERALETGEVDFKNGDWTVTGWFKRATASNMDVVMQIGQSGGYGASALSMGFYSSGNTLELRNYTSANEQDIGISRSGVTTGEWHHFAVIKSGSALHLYYDGQLVGTDNSFALAFDNTYPLKFGGPGSTTFLDRWFQGSLADLAVFRKALAATEVATLSTTPVRWAFGQMATAQVGVTVLSKLETWRQLHFGISASTGLAADDADSDGDGLANLLEYACGSDPRVVSTMPYEAKIQGDRIDFRYTINPSASDLVFQVEWSDTLDGVWQTSGIISEVEDTTGALSRVKASLPTGVTNRRFVRLRVNHP